jgi:two-component system, sensor histidine kinase LadS
VAVGGGDRNPGPDAGTAATSAIVADRRGAAVAAITRAQVSLEQALAELHELPALDTGSLGLTAHALNNFLTVSIGVVEFLQDRLRDHSDSQVRTWLQGLAHANTLMTHTVGQLMSNAVSTSTALRVDDVDLSRLVGRVCAYYERAAGLKGIQLTFNAAADVPTIRTDGVIVAAILDNLLSNAVKYSTVGARVWVDVLRAGDGARCTVRDEGPGLSEAERERLFVPGVRLGPLPTAGEPSTGYGLAIAKRFADRLGGDLACSSVQGQGTTFTLVLPRENSPDPGAPS